jgi:hypothetical protein
LYSPFYEAFSQKENEDDEEDNEDEDDGLILRIDMLEGMYQVPSVVETVCFLFINLDQTSNNKSLCNKQAWFFLSFDMLCQNSLGFRI